MFFGYQYPLSSDPGGCKVCGAPNGAECTAECNNGALSDDQVKPGNWCTKCKRELSSLLDAYYGRDPDQAKRCVKCRE